MNELEISGAVENSINIPRGLLEFQLDPNGALTQNGIIDPNKETVLSVQRAEGLLCN